MLQLRVYGPAASLTAIGEDLEAHGAAHDVALAQLLKQRGPAEDDIRLARDQARGGPPGLDRSHLVEPGVAKILALATRASSTVGVAVSITTISAAACVGVGVAVHATARAVGALAVLGINIAVLVLMGALTLVVQRRLVARGALTGGSGS
jgi:hypothetical protein